MVDQDSACGLITPHRAGAAPGSEIRCKRVAEAGLPGAVCVHAWLSGLLSARNSAGRWGGVVEQRGARGPAPTVRSCDCLLHRLGLSHMRS